MKKIKGLTLIETIAYMAVFSGIFSGVYKFQRDQMVEIEKNTFTNNVLDLMSGIDKRLSVDGFKSDSWGSTNWNNRESLSAELINKELRPKDNYSMQPFLMKKNDCEGTWEPKNELDNKSNLVQCNMWKNTIPLDLEVNGELTQDVSNFVEGFSFTFNFKDDIDFEENIIPLKKAYIKLKEKEKSQSGMSGSFQYDFIDDNENIVSISQCLELKSECMLKASFSRDGGKNEVRVDGLNSMVNSSINFIESDEDSPLTCIRWIKDSNDIWEKKVENQNCGIGIYPETSHPVIVETLAQNGTFENVMLNKECHLFNWDNVNDKLAIDSSKTSPCGFTKDNDEIYQIIENIKATNAYTQNFYFKDMDVDIFNANNIIAKDINTEFMTVSNILDINNLTTTQALEVLNFSDVNGQAYANEGFKVSGNANVKISNTVNNKINTENLIVNGNTVSDNLYGNNLTVNEGYAHKELFADSFEFVDSNTAGTNCIEDGIVSKKASGSLLVCKSGKWTTVMSDVPVGTINAWASYSIPTGWLKCNGSSIPSKYTELRSLVGNNTPDLRGRFVRGWVNGGGSSLDPDSTRGLGSTQNEDTKNHRHTEKRFIGSDGSGRGSSNASANDSVAYGYTGWSGIESRPKNYAVIYIIKAE